LIYSSKSVINTQPNMLVLQSVTDKSFNLIVCLSLCMSVHLSVCSLHICLIDYERPA
jgi:hypothetical protein